MSNRLKNVDFIKVFRIAAASCISILLASVFGLKHSSSAGIIALLSTQDTKKETLTDILIRCLSYFLSVILSLIIFKLLGYNTPAFGVFMFFLVAISYYFGWASALSSSAVVSTHFLLDKTHSMDLIINELLLLFIGVGVTMIMNLFISNNTKILNKDMTTIEQKFSLTFDAMSKYILVIDKSEYDLSKLLLLKEHLDQSNKRAIKNVNNDFFSDSNYYIAYMSARIEQFASMQRIIDNMHSLTQVPFNAIEMSNIMKKISQSIHLENNVDLIQSDFAQLSKDFDNFPIPQNREEFENLSKVHDILHELEYFLEIKSNFISSLTQKQIERFWHDFKEEDLPETFLN